MKKTTRRFFNVFLMMLICMSTCFTLACNMFNKTSKYKVKFDADGGMPTPAVQEIESGSLATKPVDPLKVIDGYDVVFEGWYDGDAKWDFAKNTVTKDVTLKAKYESTAKEYTATIKYEYDAEKTDEVKYTILNRAEKLSEIAGKLPADTDEYEYSWVVALPTELSLSNSAYTVVRETKKYDVTIVNSNSEYGTIDVSTIENVPYGTTIAVSGNKITIGDSEVTATPVSATAQYTFSFDKWTGIAESGKVEGATTINASFTAAVNTYTVTIGSNNAEYGTVSTTQIENVPYGTAIAVNGNKITIGNAEVTATPAAATAQYTFSFNNWEGSESVEGATTITANFATTTNKYTVTFMNEGKEYDAQDIEYGSLATKPTDPEKTVVGYEVVFEGWYDGDTKWDFATSTVTKDVTLTAKYENTANEYKVTVKYGYDSTKTEEITFTIANRAEKLSEIAGKLPADTAEYKYSWTTALPAELPVSNAEYTITREIQKYTITVQNNNAEYGNVSATQIENVPYGTTITVSGNKVVIGENEVTATPASATAQYTYSFTSWTGANAGTVTGAATITASFQATVNTYTVTIGSNNAEYGTVSTTKIENVPYGTTISVSGNKVTVGETEITATPTIATAQYTYSFASWSDANDSVEGATTITATFEVATNKYDVTFMNGSDTYTVQSVEYGQKATKPEVDATKDATGKTTYSFYGWYNGDAKYDFDTEITGAVTLNAKYDAVTVYASYDESKGNFDSSELNKNGSAASSNGKKVLSVNINSLSPDTGKMSIVTKNSYTDITKVTLKVTIDASKIGGGSTWWGINYFSNYSATDIYTNMKTLTSSINGDTVEFTFAEPVSGYIGIIGAVGEFVNPEMIIEEFTIYCDEGKIVDNFATSGLAETETGLFIKKDTKSQISIKSQGANLSINTVEGYALSINLSNAVSNDGNAIAFATATTHTYKSISFDIFMPKFASKTSWLGHLVISPNVGDGYCGFSNPSFNVASLTRNAWNKVEIKVDGTTATLYVNGTNKGTATVSENSYFYIALNPGDGSFDDTDVILIDNMTIVESDGTTITDDYNNRSTTILTVERSRAKNANYAVNTRVEAVKSLEATTEAFKSESVVFKTNKAYSNISSVDFDIIVQTGFNCTWGGIDFIKNPTDIYTHGTTVQFLPGLSKDKMYHVNVTISDGKLTFTAKTEGEEAKVWSPSISSNDGLYISFFQEYKADATGGYIISNFKMMADGESYTGLELFAFNDKYVATTASMNDYSFEAIKASGSIEEYLASSSYASISGSAIPEVPAGTPENFAVLIGTINFTLAGAKEFAIKLGTKDGKSVYALVDASGISIYVGTEKQGETLAFASTITYSATATTLTINGVSVAIDTIAPLKIVGFGGEGAVTINSIEASTHKLA